MNRGHDIDRAETRAGFVPYNSEAEDAALGSAMQDPEALDDVMRITSESDYFRDERQTVYRAMRRLWMNGKPVDGVTLADELVLMDALDSVGGALGLSDIQASAPTTASASYYAEIVVAKSEARSLIGAAEDTLRDCYSNRYDWKALRTRAESRFIAVGNRSNENRARPVSEIVPDVLNSASHNAGSISGQETPLSDLDILTDGIRPGQLIVLAARPGMGKSSFAQTMALHCAETLKLPALFESLEMSSLDVCRRILSQACSVPEYRLKDETRLSAADWESLSVHQHKVAAMPIYINDSRSITPHSIFADARRVKSRYGALGLVVVDYLQLLDWDGTMERRNRENEVARISRFMKVMAGELACPVVCVSQLNRSAETREDKRPRMADLRESGAIEQDADIIILMHRPAYYKLGDNEGVCEFNVTKNRGGKTGEFEALWEPEYYRISDKSIHNLTGTVAGPDPAPDAAF